MINTPPLGFALKVGSASRKRCRFAFTLVDQHWKEVSEGDIQSGIEFYFIPLVVGQPIKVAEGCEFGPTLDPGQSISLLPDQLRNCHTALEITTSSPPNWAMVCLTTFSQSTRIPISYQISGISVGSGLPGRHSSI